MKNEIVVRPLGRREESLWVSLGVVDSDLETRKVKLAEYLDQNPTLPKENFLCAFCEGRFVGKMSGILESTGYMATKMFLDQNVNEMEVSRALFKYVRKFGAVQALSWADRDDDRMWRALLKSNGFSVLQDKAYYRKNITEYVAPLPQEVITYKSMAEIGREMTLKIFSLTYVENLNRNFTMPELDFKSNEESAGELFDPNGWFVAYISDQPIGVLLPQIFPDSPKEGTLMGFGLVQEYRGRGLGKALHAKGMEILSRQGATDYIGSTDIQNLSMIRIFGTNGCERIGIRTTHLGPTANSS